MPDNMDTFDVGGALSAGAYPQEIKDYLSNNQGLQLINAPDNWDKPSQLDQASTIQSSGNPELDNAMMIQKYFPREEWGRAYNVMMGESGGRANAVGDNYPINGETIPSYGLFQIRGLPGRPSADQLTNPEFNVQYAAQMFKNQGWGPWTAARNLGYVQ